MAATLVMKVTAIMAVWQHYKSIISADKAGINS